MIYRRLIYPEKWGTIYLDQPKWGNSPWDRWIEDTLENCLLPSLLEEKYREIRDMYRVYDL